LSEPLPYGAKIRRPLSDEVDLMTQLCLRSKKSVGYDDAFMAQCVDELTVTREKLRQGEFWVFVTDQIDGLVCLKVDLERREGEIESFFIAPESQNQGIGRSLWRKVLERAECLGLKRLHLDSEPLSVGFYEKLGFKIVGQTPSGSIPGRMLPLMEMTIPA